MGIGYASGAFDALAAFDAPAPCDLIASQGGLDERYLQEWLGAMVSGGIVEITVDGDEELFFSAERICSVADPCGRQYKHGSLHTGDSFADNLCS